MKYTQGNWKPQGNPDGDMGIWQGSEPICFLPRYQRDSIHPNVNDVLTRESLAHLLASAPELYSALKNLVDRGLIKDPDGDHYQEVLDALAKAEGK